MLLWKLPVAVAALLIPTIAHGQRLSTPLPSLAIAPATTFHFDSLTRVKPPPTYWLEGGIIGGVALGTIAGVGFHDLCESPHCTAAFVAGFVLGGVTGFTAGALIGGQFRKHG